MLLLIPNDVRLRYFVAFTLENSTPRQLNNCMISSAIRRVEISSINGQRHSKVVNYKSSYNNVCDCPNQILILCLVSEVDSDLDVAPSGAKSKSVGLWNGAAS
jgi:hypothetical protein